MPCGVSGSKGVRPDGSLVFPDLVASPHGLPEFESKTKSLGGDHVPTNKRPSFSSKAIGKFAVALSGGQLVVNLPVDLSATTIASRVGTFAKMRLPFCSTWKDSGWFPKSILVMTWSFVAFIMPNPAPYPTP